MTRGGAREGAGRPLGSVMPKTRKKVSVYLPAWLATWLKRKKGSQGRLIERALVGFYNLKERREH